VPVALLVAFGLTVPKPDRAEGLGTYLRNMAATASRPETLVLFAGSLFTFMVLYGAFVTYLPFYLETEFGLSSAGYGTVLAAHAVGSAAGSIWLGTLIRLFSRKTVLLTSFATMAIGVLGLGLPVGIWAIYVFAAVAGAAMGIALSNIQVLLTETSPLAQRGGIIAWNGTMFRLGQTAGPAVLGVALALIAIAVRRHGG
jgi:ACDE family multidrug resistance protein